MQGMRKSPSIWKSRGHTVYLITFYAGEGTCETAFAYTDVEGKLSALPEAARDNYDFNGWYAPSGELVTADTVYTADTVLTAGWTYNPVVTITVTGTGATGPAQMAYLVMPDGTTVSSAGTYQAKVGETIECYVKNENGRERYVFVNGGTTSLESDYFSVGDVRYRYKYTVVKNATIQLTKTTERMSISITET